MREATERRIPNPSRRAPALPVVLSFSAGIIADWQWSLPFSTSLLLTACFAIAWAMIFACRKNTAASRLAAIGLLAACGFLGAAWHQFQWSLVSDHDLLAFAADEPRPVRLLATVASDPVLVHPEPTSFPAAIPKRLRTLCNVRTVALIDQHGEIPVCGLARLEIVGNMEALLPGTRVDILGTLSLPSVSRNPGGFDFQLFLRERGIRTIVRCDFPDCVRTVESAPRGFWRLFQSWQKTSADRLRQLLSKSNSPIATALLLGPRTDIPQELKEAFLNSGTVHLLAISGINVAILTGLLWFCGRALRLPRLVHLALLAVGIWAYVMITDLDPPVARAAVLASVLLLSLFLGRPTSPLNQLALAALAIVACDPHDLFQVGAQLSFLAILALQWLWSQPWFHASTPADPLDELGKARWRIWAEWLVHVTWQTFAATTVVWVFTLPLILARFHLVSPVGFLANFLLPVFVGWTLVIGYGCLFGVLFFPPLAWLLGPCFDFCLSVFTQSVRWAAAVPGGHFPLPGPPGWWLAIYYVLIITIGSGILIARSRPIAWRALLIWCVFGIAWGIPPRTNPGLRCTFLSVGHGVAILIEFPNRQTLLYDAGSLENASRARMAVDNLLFERGLTHLDVVLISHADVDHFNSVPGLLEDIAIGEILIGPAFLDFQQESVTRVCEAAIQTAVPLKLVWAGDALKFGDDVTVKIIHPEVVRPSGDDNANSIVLSIEYSGRRILLTGDLEKGGLLSLLRQPSQPHDILLSPHHGSQKANPPELARWAAPRWVVVSGGDNVAWQKLRENYGAGAELLSTGIHGAITFDISDTGEIAVETHLPPVAIVDPAGTP